jgi:hypothetical protein
MQRGQIACTARPSFSEGQITPQVLITRNKHDRRTVQGDPRAASLVVAVALLGFIAGVLLAFAWQYL